MSTLPRVPCTGYEGEKQLTLRLMMSAGVPQSARKIDPEMVTNTWDLQ